MLPSSATLLSLSVAATPSRDLRFPQTLVTGWLVPWLHFCLNNKDTISSSFSIDASGSGLVGGIVWACLRQAGDHTPNDVRTYNSRSRIYEVFLYDVQSNGCTQTVD
jgi:hypothetical protein